MSSEPPVGEAPPLPEAVPVCPRHPSRESYVRCQRCERPVCPDCQRPAAVGVQCVDCVKQQAKTVRAPRAVFGGSATGGRPLVTQVIIGACAVAYVLQWAVPNFTGNYDFWPGAALEQPIRFLSSAFLHLQGLPFHILMNMWLLWLLGQELEPLLGRARFAATYLLSAIGGSVVYLLMAAPVSYEAVENGFATKPWYAPTWDQGAVGASGAVFGLLGALLVVNKRMRRDNRGLWTLILINAAIGFIGGLNIAWQDHLGGLLTGAACAAVIAYAPAARRRVLHPLGLVVVAGLLVGLVLLKVSTLPVDLLPAWWSS